VECFGVLFVLFLIFIVRIIEMVQKATGKSKSSSIHSSNRKPGRFVSNTKDENSLANGYTRQDYYDYGYSDFDIEYWGLDQPSAPSPPASGFVIADMMDGDLDGDIDFPF
jgi:hypothetical protein